MLITRPRTSFCGPRGSCVSICCTARLQQRKTPRRLTAIKASQSSSVVSSSPFEWRPRKTALLTITSSRPDLCTAVETTWSMLVQRATSVATYTALPPPRRLRRRSVPRPRGDLRGCRRPPRRPPPDRTRGPSLDPAPSFHRSPRSSCRAGAPSSCPQIHCHPITGVKAPFVLAQCLLPLISFAGGARKKPAPQTPSPAERLAAGGFGVAAAKN